MGEIVEGYMDGFRDDRKEEPDSLENRSALYRHGWRNGRDDRVGQPRALADEIRRQLAAAEREDAS